MSRKANQISRVALIRSDVKHAEQIPEEEIRKMVHEAVVLTGRIFRYYCCEDGHIVVIKPNLISTRATPWTGQCNHDVIQ